jgi:dTDP-4-dehydrorhamnose reductase
VLGRIVITGAGGQLGQELLASAAPELDCIALSRVDLDISDTVAVSDCIAAHTPQLVINAAAYTAVDLAESESEAAFSINAKGTANLAAACAEQGARLIHVSTDFVFNGDSGKPYKVDDATDPLGVYGESKLAGELALWKLTSDALIIRTSWVYSQFGGNFVSTMLRLMSEREDLSVVADQVGSPTWTGGLAQAIWAVAAKPELRGTYHWTDAGVCSWYDFAVAIQEEAVALGLLASPARIHPITTDDYPTPARRPAYSVLAKETSWQDFDLPGVHWRVQLRKLLKIMGESPNE